jgi:hypothetical protein
MSSRQGTKIRLAYLSANWFARPVAGRAEKGMTATIVTMSEFSMAKQDGNSLHERRRGPDGISSSEGKDPVGRAIGVRLKSLYDEVAREPVPERFMTLLDQLASQDEPGVKATEERS